VAEVRSLGHGRYLLTDDGGQRIAYAAGPPHARWVFLEGRVFLVDTTASAPTRRGHEHDDQIALSSPMPATVVAIRVTPGQQVNDGDVLITLEAMKMELPIRAPRAGTVRGIRCQPRELVQPGVPLVDLE